MPNSEAKPRPRSGQSWFGIILAVSAGLHVGLLFLFPQHSVQGNPVNADYRPVTLEDLSVLAPQAPVIQPPAPEPPPPPQAEAVASDTAPPVQDPNPQDETLTRVSPVAAQDNYLPSYVIDQLPEVQRYGEKRYPALARERGREGLVVLEVWFDASGVIARVEVVRSAGWGFDEAAMDFVRSCGWKPATFQGRAVSVRMRVPVRFSLSD